MTRAARQTLDAASIALLLLIAIGTGHLILKAALNLTETATRAAALKGM